jgi:hypothetical protein
MCMDKVVNRSETDLKELIICIAKCCIIVVLILPLIAVPIVALAVPLSLKFPGYDGATAGDQTQSGNFRDRTQFGNFHVRPSFLLMVAIE